MELTLARSKAGHDKDQLYLVYAFDRDADNVILVNGKNRTVERPKIKREKHVQLIKHLNRDLVLLYEQSNLIDDVLVRKILKQYQEENSCRKQT